MERTDSLTQQEVFPCVILAGGLGTRISEETDHKPKPMIEIGGLPVLLHIMRHYYRSGFRDFVVCAGYKADVIKQFFLNYEFRCNNIEIDHRDLPNNPPKAFGASQTQEAWRVRIIDTGLNTMTGARLAKAFDAIEVTLESDTFAVTYGDGLCSVDLDAELAFHSKHGKLGTVMGVRPVARFGELDLSPDGQVRAFLEKPEFKQSLINGGFFFFNKKVRDYLSDDSECILERKPLEKLAKDGHLMMFQHDGFWHPMDTLRDKNYLQGLWDTGEAPWLGAP